MIIWANVDPDPCPSMVPLRHNELKACTKLILEWKYSQKQIYEARRVHILWVVRFMRVGAKQRGNAISNTESLEW